MKAVKNILTIFIIFLTISCAKGGVERIDVDKTGYNYILASTTWDGDSMRINFVDDKKATILSSLQRIPIDKFNVSYILGYDHLGMLSEHITDYSLGINIQNSKFITDDSFETEFVFLLTNEGIVDTIRYKELFIKQY